jgi:hypothetical protein
VDGAEREILDRSFYAKKWFTPLTQVFPAGGDPALGFPARLHQLMHCPLGALQQNKVRSSRLAPLLDAGDGDGTARAEGAREAAAARPRETRLKSIKREEES